jgi:hypothetical protein
MSTLPQIGSKNRPPRLYLESNTPAVLRFEDGERICGHLHVVSLTGGLLSLSNSVTDGSRVQLMFVTGAGSVMAGAVMLPPVNRTLQPFRFVALTPKDRRRLETVIPLSVYHDITEPDWMKKLRAVSERRYQPPPPPRKYVRLAVGAAVLVTLGLGLAGVMYALNTSLLKHIGR